MQDSTNNKTYQMPPLSMEIDESNMEKYETKCYYYNRGYCKKKNNCLFFHPTTDCLENCPGKTICNKRHRKICKYGIKCYHNNQKLCEFRHDNSDHIYDRTKDDTMKKLKSLLKIHIEIK